VAAVLITHDAYPVTIHSGTPVTVTEDCQAGFSAEDAETGPTIYAGQTFIWPGPPYSRHGSEKATLYVRTKAAAAATLNYMSNEGIHADWYHGRRAERR
jgi:hypothetical protein